MCKDSSSPFADLSGTETFEKGEEESNIEIKIPQDPRDVTKDKFDVILGDPKPSTSQVPKKNKCNVTVENDVIPSVINIDLDELEVVQSEGSFEVPVRRSEQKKGKVVVPWKVVPKSSDSVYANIAGLFILKNFDIN